MRAIERQWSGQLKRGRSPTRAHQCATHIISTRRESTLFYFLLEAVCGADLCVNAECAVLKLLGGQDFIAAAAARSVPFIYIYKYI